MNFYFGDVNGNELMKRINLRNLAKMANQWEHPYVAAKNIFSNFEKYHRNLLKIPKDLREAFAISIMTMALAEDTKKDWWYFKPTGETPDGIIISLDKRNDGYWGVTREIEVVEHRDIEKSILDRIIEKLNGSYVPETVILCYVISNGAYNFQQISNELMNTKTKLDHAFIAYWGTQINKNSPLSENDLFKFTLVQLIPKFFSLSIDLKIVKDDYEKKYAEGTELRLVEGNTIYAATRNPNFRKQSNS